MIEIEMSMKPDLLSSMIKRAGALLKKEEPLTETAFRYLLNPIKENLYNFVFKALYFSEDAEDVYQETVLRAFKYRSTYNRNHSFKTWIFSIAHNEIKTYFNKRKRDRTLLNAQLSPDVLAHQDKDTGDLIRDIYEAARQLKPKQRQVFFLFYDQRFSILEINEITGLKPGNIKFILNRAREYIKQQLKVKGGKNE